MAAIPKLTDVLVNSMYFTQTDSESYIPPDQQHVYLALAEKFQSRISHLYEDPDELAEHLGGTPEVWEEFLNLDPVRLYVAARTKNLAQVHARKSMSNLQKQAARGDVQSIKYLNEISGLLNKQGADNRIIVLTHVPRPAKNPYIEDRESEKA